MFQEMNLMKEIHVETTNEKLWWHLTNLDGLSKWLIESGCYSNKELDPELNLRFEYRYNNVTNRGTVRQLTPYTLVQLRNHYSLSMNNKTSIKFPLQTTFCLNPTQSGGTTLVVELKGFYGEFGQMLKEIFDYTYSKVLLNLKSVIELGIDLRSILFQETDLGLFYESVTAQDGSAERKGTKITLIKANGIGELAGIQINDILVRINDQDVGDYIQLSRIAHQFKRKDRIEFQIVRDGQQKTLIYDHSLLGGE